MNPTAAENFINSLVRNLQVLCHSNVEFRNDIEVVGHLYLKVDKSKKISYIVDETVLKNDSSSTVFVSNSYHSVNTSKKKPNENQEEGRSAENVSDKNQQQGTNTSTRSEHKRSAHQLVEERQITKARKRSENDKSSKSFQPPSSSHGNSTGNLTSIKTESVDLSIIKNEPSTDEDDNLPCFFASDDSSPQKEENLQDIGQNMNPHGVHHFLTTPSLILPHPPLLSASSHPDICQSTSSNNDLLVEMKSSLNQPVHELLMASNEVPPPTIQELCNRFHFEENIVRGYLKHKTELLDAIEKSQRLFSSITPSNKRITLEEKVQLIQMAELDSVNRPSQAMLAKHFGISQPTTCRILSQKDKILEEYQKLQHNPKNHLKESDTDEVILL